MTRRQPPMLTEQTATSQRVSLVGEPSQHHDACDPAATPPRTQRCGRRRALSCSCCAVLVAALGACAFVFWPRLLVVCVHYLRITAGLSVSTIPPSAAVHLVVPVSFDSSNLWTLRLSAIEIDAYRAGAHGPMSRGVATEVAVSAGGVSSTSFVLTPVPSLGAERLLDDYLYFMGRCGHDLGSGTWHLDLQFTLKAYGLRVAFWVRGLEMPCRPDTVVPLPHATPSGPRCPDETGATLGVFCQRLLCAVDDLGCSRDCPEGNASSAIGAALVAS